MFVRLIERGDLYQFFRLRVLFNKGDITLGNRVEQLDSLRGLASITVLFHHIFLIPLALSPLWDYTFGKLPTSILVNGDAAVIFFFVLSGYVLSIPFFNNKEFNYAPYLVKRICRIYLPYLATVVPVLVFLFFFNANGIKELSLWFNSFWKSSPNFNLVLEHIFFIGNIHSDAVNPVIWSLIHELRISIIFPFIIMFVKRSKWQLSILIGLGLTIMEA